MYAQKAYVSVAQNGAKVDAVGTAQYDVSATLSIEFVGNKAVMKSGSNYAAELMISQGAQLVVEFASTSENKITKSVSSSGYATLFSPFNLVVPDGDVEVYAPTYENGSIHLTDATRVPAGSVIPSRTGIILKNEGDITFAFSADAPSNIESCLSGSSVIIDKPTEGTYTLGHESTTGEYGFFKYTGTTMAAGKAFLITDAAGASPIHFVFDEEESTTAISNIIEQSSSDGKRIENGNLIIVKDGKKYSSTGVRL